MAYPTLNVNVLSLTLETMAGPRGGPSIGHGRTHVQPIIVGNNILPPSQNKFVWALLDT